MAFRTTFYSMDSGEEIYNSKKVAVRYIQSSFFVDFVSTVPVDTIGAFITGESNPLLKLFSLLKLVRVTRLGKMIARMNVSQQQKHLMKLFQLIFFIIMYLHCAGCLWFVIVQQDEKWVPPLDYINEDADLFQSGTYTHYQYWVSVYYAVVQMTGNDLVPIGTF